MFTDVLISPQRATFLVSRRPTVKNTDDSPAYRYAFRLLCSGFDAFAERTDAARHRLHAPMIATSRVFFISRVKKTAISS